MSAPPSFPATELLRRLRTETGALHHELDALVSRTVASSREVYGAFLTASLCAVSSIERGIEKHLGAEYRAKREELLLADLAALRIPAPSSAFHFEPTSEASAYGCAYVVEGSALGGIVLANRGASALGGRAPSSYLQCGNAHPGGRWRWFLSELAAFEQRTRRTDHDEACAAACSAFQQYSLAFQLILKAPVARGV